MKTQEGIEHPARFIRYLDNNEMKCATKHTIEEIEQEAREYREGEFVII